jgi:hypothetical protein
MKITIVNLSELVWIESWRGSDEILNHKMDQVKPGAHIVIVLVW